MLSIVIHLLLAIHVMVSLLIILVVLMQRPKNEGLGAAFGGGMTENLFGAQTTNVLQKFTRWLGGIFFLLTLSLSMLYAKQANINSRTEIEKQLSSVPRPVSPLPLPSTPSSSPSQFAPGSVTPLATATPSATLPVASPSLSPPKKSASPAPSEAAKQLPAGAQQKDGVQH